MVAVEQQQYSLHRDRLSTFNNKGLNSSFAINALKNTKTLYPMAYPPFHARYVNEPNLGKSCR